MNLRFAGMLAAVLVAYSPALLTSAFQLPLGAYGAIGLMGAPLAGLLGWWLTPTAMTGSWRWAGAVGLGMGVLAAPLGAWTVAYVGLVARMAGINPTSSLDPAAEALFVALIGLPISFIALPLTVPCGLAWAVCIRGPLRHAARNAEIPATSVGVTHVAIVLAVVIVGAALVPATRGR